MKPWLRLVPPPTPEQEEQQARDELAQIRRRVSAAAFASPQLKVALRVATQAIDENEGEREALILLVSVLADPASSAVPELPKDPQDRPS